MVIYYKQSGEVEASRSRGDEERGVADCGRLGFWPSGLVGWGDGWLEYLFDWSGDGPSWALGARWEIGSTYRTGRFPGKIPAEITGEIR